MVKNLLDFYKAEYESDPVLTIEGLATKYALDIADLGDTSTWKKQVEVVEPEPLANGTLVPQSSSQAEELALNIAEYKRLAVQEALYRISTYGAGLDIKELKELTAVVDIIDKSTRSTAEGAKVNVLIQNIVNKFKDEI